MGIATPPPFDNSTVVPTVIQEQTSGPVVAQKAALGITPNDPSATQTFTQVGNQNNLWKYEASSGNPTLDAPLSMTRVAGGEDQESQAWLVFKEDIIQSLPLDVQVGLRTNPSWSVLEHLINHTANLEFGIVNAKNLSETENSQNEALLNSRLPGIITGNMVQEAVNLAEMLKEELKNQLNHPSYDTWMNQINQFESQLRRLPHE